MVQPTFNKSYFKNKSDLKIHVKMTNISEVAERIKITAVFMI
jgi:hypothetical protein